MAMILQEVWSTDDTLTWLPWVQGISDVPVNHIECWHSEFTDPGSPWVEWRIIDTNGRCRVAWRVPAGSHTPVPPA